MQRLSMAIKNKIGILVLITVLATLAIIFLGITIGDNVKYINDLKATQAAILESQGEYISLDVGPQEKAITYCSISMLIVIAITGVAYVFALKQPKAAR